MRLCLQYWDGNGPQHPVIHLAIIALTNMHCKHIDMQLSGVGDDEVDSI
jgi:hypothetical protein